MITITIFDCYTNTDQNTLYVLAPVLKYDCIHYWRHCDKWKIKSIKELLKERTIGESATMTLKEAREVSKNTAISLLCIYQKHFWKRENFSVIWNRLLKLPIDFEVLSPGFEVWAAFLCSLKCRLNRVGTQSGTSWQAGGQFCL